MIVPAVEQSKLLQINPKKKSQDFNGIRTHGLCVSAAVFYQKPIESNIWY